MTLAEIEALSTKRTNRLVAQAILRIEDRLVERTCIDRARIHEDLFRCVAKDTEGEAAFFTARYESAILDMIDMIVLEGVEMTVALPVAWYKHDKSIMPDALRPVLNLITPYQTDSKWTCATLAKPRNAVATWGIAQGCFVEVIIEGQSVIRRIDKAYGYPLSMKDSQNETGQIVKKPIVTYLWPAKAARCHKFAARVGMTREDMDAILVSFGCPADMLAELDSAVSSARRSTVTKEAKVKALYNALLSALNDDDDDDNDTDV